MAAPPTWKERDNCVRCCSLILDGSGYFSKQLLLQETISNRKFSSIEALLAANQQKLNKLKSKHIVNETQYLLMFPLNGNSPQLDKWDITLTTLVLTNCVTLSQNQKDAIRDIRDIRNTVHGHTIQMAMTEFEFQQTWTDISTKLKHCSTLLTYHNCQTRLNEMIASIQREVLSSDKVVEIFKEWYESEKEIETLIGGLANKIDTHAEAQKRKSDQLHQGIIAVKSKIGTPGAGDQTNTQLQHRPYTATHAGDFSVKTNDDTSDCHIWGSCMSQDGSLLLSDYNNKKLKRLDSSYRVIDVCDMNEYPMYVCCISATEVAVSTGMGSTRIKFVSVSGKLTRTRSIQLEHGCNGLDSSSGELYVCDGRRNIHVYSTDGLSQRTINVSEYGDASFTFCSIAVSDDGSQIYVCMDGSLVCLDKQGQLVWKYTDDALRCYSGVCVDNDNNVCVRSGKAVLQISPTGQKIGVVIQMKTEDTRSSMCYDRIRSRLLVTQYECDHISVYDLTT